MRRFESPGPKRRLLLGGFTGAAALLTTASVAFACTTYLGQLTVQGNGNNPDRAAKKRPAVNVIGSGRGMSYCGGNALGSVNPGAGTTFVDRVSPPANSVNISLAPTDACKSARWGGNLPDGLYNVNFMNNAAFVGEGDSRVWTLDCMSSADDFPSDPARAALNADTKRVGQIAVANGVASGEFNVGNALLANGAGDESALCVVNTPGTYTDVNGTVRTLGRGAVGQQAPIIVL